MFIGHDENRTANEIYLYSNLLPRSNEYKISNHNWSVSTRAVCKLKECEKWKIKYFWQWNWQQWLNFCLVWLPTTMSFKQSFRHSGITSADAPPALRLCRLQSCIGRSGIKNAKHYLLRLSIRQRNRTIKLITSGTTKENKLAKNELFTVCWKEAAKNCC